MPSIERVDYGAADGATLGGASTDKIGFYGTAATQPAVITAVTTTSASSTTNAYAYTTAAQADAIVASLNAVIAALKTTGLVASA